MFRRKADGLDLASSVKTLDVLVLDEADRLLDMGFEARYTVGLRSCLLFTYTSAGELVRKFLILL